MNPALESTCATTATAEVTPVKRGLGYVQEPSHMELFGEFKSPCIIGQQKKMEKKKYWNGKHLNLPNISMDIKKEMAQKLGVPLPQEWKKLKKTQKMRALSSSPKTPTLTPIHTSLHKMSLQFILNSSDNMTSIPATIFEQQFAQTENL